MDPLVNAALEIYFTEFYSLLVASFLLHHLNGSGAQYPQAEEHWSPYLKGRVHPGSRLMRPCVLLSLLTSTAADVVLV